MFGILPLSVGTRTWMTDEHTVVEISKKKRAELEAFTPDYLMEKMGLTLTFSVYHSQGAHG